MGVNEPEGVGDPELRERVEETLEAVREPMPDCECTYWAIAPEMGPRRADGHHPLCNATHDRDTCMCKRCRFDRMLRRAQRRLGEEEKGSKESTSPKK
jgi:hypothetical protein